MNTIFPIILVLATLFVSLTTGFLFSFAVVAMPGLKKLDDGAFIRAFQEIDGIIQNNHPLFMLMWMGSVILLVVAGVMGFIHLEGFQRNFLLAATFLYILGVQAPTIAINIPRNNDIQAVNVATANMMTLQKVRDDFEDVWNRANQFRTVMAIIVTAILLSLILWL